MKCEGCVSNIRAALEGAADVSNFDIKLQDKSVEVETGLTQEAAADIIIKAGYDARPAKEKSGFLKRIIGS